MSSKRSSRAANNDGGSQEKKSLSQVFTIHKPSSKKTNKLDNGFQINISKAFLYIGSFHSLTTFFLFVFFHATCLCSPARSFAFVHTFFKQCFNFSILLLHCCYFAFWFIEEWEQRVPIYCESAIFKRTRLCMVTVKVTCFIVQ